MLSSALFLSLSFCATILTFCYFLGPALPPDRPHSVSCLQRSPGSNPGMCRMHSQTAGTLLSQVLWHRSAWTHGGGGGRADTPGWLSRTGKHRMRTEVLWEKIPLRVHVSPSFDLECLCGKCHVSSDILDEYLENSHAFGPITLSDSLGFILVCCCHGSGALFLTASQSRHGKSNQITYVWAPISSLRMFLCLLI